MLQVVINKIHWWVCAINCTVDRRSCCSHRNSHRSDSQTFVENRDFCLPNLHSTSSLGGGCLSEYCHDVRTGNTIMVWLPAVVKTFWRYVYSFWQNPRTWQTDTARRHRPRLCIASRGKNSDSCRGETFWTTGVMRN